MRIADDGPGDRPERIDELGRRDGQADEQEHGGGQEIGDELPDRVDLVAAADRAGSRRPHVPEDDRCRHGGDDPGQVEPVREQVAAVRQDDREGQLDQVVVHPRGHPGGHEPGHRADQHAEGDRPGEGHDGVERGRRGVDDADGDREQHQARAVVEEALAVDQRGQAMGHGQTLERGHHSGRVRRRHHRTDDECEIRAEPGREGQHERDHGRRDDHARDRQQGQPAEPPAQLDEMQPVCGLEHEPRQEHDQDQLGRDLDRRIAGDARADADDETGDDQRDRVGQAERPGDDRHEDRQGQEADQQLDRVRDLLAGHQGVTRIGGSSPGRLGLSHVDALEDA